MRSNKKYKVTILILSVLAITEAIIIIYLWVSRPIPLKVTKVAAGIRGKIAIVIDDWGYNRNNLFLAEQIKYPLTMAVLPNHNYLIVVGEGDDINPVS